MEFWALDTSKFLVGLLSGVQKVSGRYKILYLDTFLGISIQGQARGYGRITQKRGRTTVGHYFQDLFTAKPLDIHHLLGYQMNDLDIVFPKIPHNTL